MSFAAKISSKGQLTLPRDVRKALGSNTVEIEIVGEKIILFQEADGGQPAPLS